MKTSTHPLGAATVTANKALVLCAAKEKSMMNEMGSMGWGMGLFGLLILILLVLGIAALVKYLMSGRK